MTQEPKEARQIVQETREKLQEARMNAMGLENLARRQGTSTYFAKTDGYAFMDQSDNMGGIRLSTDKKPSINEKSISLTDAAEMIKGGAPVRNTDPIYVARRDNTDVTATQHLITDEIDGLDWMKHYGYKQLDATKVGEQEKKRDMTVRDFVGSAQLPEDRKWTQNFKLGDFEKYESLEVEDFTKASHDKPREPKTANELNQDFPPHRVGEYDAASPYSKHDEIEVSGSHKEMYDHIKRLQVNIQETEINGNSRANSSYRKEWLYMLNNRQFEDNYVTKDIKEWRKQQTDSFVDRIEKMEEDIKKGIIQRNDMIKKMDNLKKEYDEEEMQRILEVVKQRAENE